MVRYIVNKAKKAVLRMCLAPQFSINLTADVQLNESVKLKAGITEVFTDRVVNQQQNNAEQGGSIVM